MHELLQKQIKQFFGSIDEVPENIQSFVKEVENSYKNFEQEKLSIKNKLTNCEISNNIAGNLKQEILKTKKLNSELQFVNKIVNNLSDAVHVADENGDYVYVNEESTKRNLLSKEQLLSMNIADLDSNFKKGGILTWQDHVNYLKVRGKLIVETTYKKGDGAIMPIEVMADYFEQDQKAYVVAVMRDITERKRLEAERIEREARFTAVFNNPTIRIVIKDFDDKILLINNSLKDQLQYKEDQLIGESFSNFIDVNQVEKYLDLIKQAENGDIDSFEITLNYVKKDKTFFIGKTFVAVIKKPNEEAYLVALIEDVTKQDAAEKAKNNYLKKLEHINRDLEDFAHMVSHDLKAPLRGINTLTHWLKEDNYDKFDEEGQKNVDLIIERTIKMDALINDILEYSALGAVVKKENVDLNIKINDIKESIDFNPNVRIRINGTLPVLHNYDETRIYQLLQNLITNAINYNDKKDGFVEIGAKVIDDKCEIYVKDNGIGIDKKYHKKIFEVFQRINTSIASSTGIGLAIVSKIVHLYGGKIRLESELNKGTTFFITLPMVYEEKEK